MKNITCKTFFGINAIFVILLALFTGFALTSCKDDPIDDNSNNGDNGDNGKEPPVEDKAFVVYDLLPYLDKPSLFSEKLSQIGVVPASLLTSVTVESDTVLDNGKISAMAELANLKSYKTVLLDLDDWYLNAGISSYELNKRVSTVLGSFKESITHGKVGVHASPVANLASFNYMNEGSDEEILSAWRRANESKWISTRDVTFYSPMALAATSDFDSWREDVETMIEEIKDRGSDKKIFLCLSPQFDDLPGNPNSKKFVQPSLFEQMIEAARELSDGVILVGFSTDSSGTPISWENSGMQGVFEKVKAFIAEYEEDIALEEPPVIDREKDPVNKTSFRLFHDISFEGTPDLVDRYNMFPVISVSESDISSGTAPGGILTPDVQKIEALAASALEDSNTPVLVDAIDTWMNDKVSNTTSMADRFRLVSETFKGHNSLSSLMFRNVAPSSMTVHRLAEGVPEDSVLYYWFIENAVPERELRGFSDVLLPSAIAIDDDIDRWKEDFHTMVDEANKNKSTSKPVYAYLHTRYATSDGVGELVKEETFAAMLETIYRRCDGVVIVDNSPGAPPVTWSDDLGVVRAISGFYENYKEVIGESVIDDSKQFAIYDAIAYPGKPPLQPYGLMPVNLIYEAQLTQPNPSNPNQVILDMDKINAMAKLSAEFPDVMVSTDVEDWWGLDEHEMYYRFNTIFEAFRRENPSVFIGNYGVSPSALCVRRFYDEGKTPETEFLASWRNHNAAKWKTLKETADAAMPSVYIAEPNIESWISDLKITVDEIRKYSDKKIIIYIWPQYYDKPDSPYFREFVAPGIWTQMLEAAYKYTDGVIIWSSVRDKNDEYAYWNRPEVQAVWEATKEFIQRRSKNITKPGPEKERIFLDNPSKEFKLFGSFTYSGMPNLAEQGIHSIRVVNERDLSNGTLTDNVYEPVMSKVEALAQQTSHSPSIPVYITGGTWIRERSTDQQKMINRYRDVQAAFKNMNPEGELGYFNIGPSSLSGLRVTGGNFFTNMASWKHTANLIRPIREFSDYVVPASYAVDDHIDLWKREFYLTVQDARIENPDKPVYAHLYTDYFNNTNNFSESYKPISEEILTEMLEAVFKICDGVILTNLTAGAWNSQSGYWKAIEKFVNKHRSNIVFPETSPGGGEDDPDNLIVNGGFEDIIVPSGTELTFNNVEYVSFVNSLGFFDKFSRTTSPNLPEPLVIPDYAWFERGTTQHQCRTQVDHLKSYSGAKSAFLWNIGGNTSNATSGPNGWYYHNLSQRVSLDDSKKYEFSFYALREQITVHQNENTLKDIYVGIISSTDALPAHNQTYSQKVTLPEGDYANWNEVKVVFDLPAIIAENPGKSFENCAVFIGIRTEWDGEKTLHAKVNIDEVRLTEVK